jgi:Leucine-rich repeat (LRR) protein
MRIIFIIFLFVYGASAAVVPCKFEVHQIYGYYCNLFSASYSVTTENELITVTGTHIAPNTAANVINLHLSGSLNFVPTRIFETFQNVESLGLANSKQLTMTTNAIKNCLKLKFIMIQNNYIPALPASFAESCVNLKQLEMHRNQIQSVHKDAFKGLANLEHLSWSGNAFESLDPGTFVHTPKLVHLYIYDGKLKTLHPDLFLPLSVTYMMIYRHPLQSIPALKFKSISSMRIVSFRENQITEVDPDLVKNYPGILNSFELDFEQNICSSQKYTAKQQFVGLQQCYDNWSKSHSSNPCQTCLSQRVCSFRIINGSYTCVISGVSLALKSIGGTHETINGRIYTDADVTSVHINNSTLSRIPGVIFTKFPNAEFLSVPSTKMSVINDNTFETCGNLKRIDASGNFISKVVKTSLQKCQKLETVNLSGNLVRNIEGDLFKFTPSLKQVILKAI